MRARSPFLTLLSRPLAFSGVLALWLELGALDLAPARGPYDDVTTAEGWSWSRIKRDEVADFNEHCGTKPPLGETTAARKLLTHALGRVAGQFKFDPRCATSRQCGFFRSWEVSIGAAVRGLRPFNGPKVRKRKFRRTDRVGNHQDDCNSTDPLHIRNRAPPDGTLEGVLPRSSKIRPARIDGDRDRFVDPSPGLGDGGEQSAPAFRPVHGFRSTFRDWYGEVTNFPREIAEAALAHVTGDKAERAYRRGRTSPRTICLHLICAIIAGVRNLRPSEDEEKGGKRHEMPAHHTLEAYLDAYIEAAGIRDGGKSPLFRSAVGRTGTLTATAMHRVDAWRMIQRRAAELGTRARIGCHTFRATGITAYLEAGGTLENAQAMAAHESPRTTKLYDRTGDEITLDEVERITI